MSDQSLSTEQILGMLAAAPPRLAELSAGLTAAQLRTAPAAGEWSANEVLAHMRSCADMWGDCMAAILAGAPTLRAVNPRTWIERTDYLDQEFGASLEAFAVQRRSLLAVLEPLTPAAWSREATVTGAGKPLTRSVLFYARWLATHERPHLKQIARVVNTLRQTAPER